MITTLVDKLQRRLTRYIMHIFLSFLYDTLELLMVLRTDKDLGTYLSMEDVSTIIMMNLYLVLIKYECQTNVLNLMNVKHECF